jgi:hypothetical protein
MGDHDSYSDKSFKRFATGGLCADKFCTSVIHRRFSNCMGSKKQRGLP